MIAFRSSASSTFRHCASLVFVHSSPNKLDHGVLTVRFMNRTMTARPPRPPTNLKVPSPMPMPMSCPVLCCPVLLSFPVPDNDDLWPMPMSCPVLSRTMTAPPPRPLAYAYACPVPDNDGPTSTTSGPCPCLCLCPVLSRTMTVRPPRPLAYAYAYVLSCPGQ